MPNTVVIVGAQWGDEGKGKIIDILSERADVIVRSQGGSNAGHTVIAKGVEYKFHLIPSGILYPHTKCYITGGTVIDPAVLLKEIEGLLACGVSLEGRLFLSAFAHLIFPYHRKLDLLYEESKGALAIGTTGKGIGPCYADKANRIGIQVGELLDKERFVKRLRLVAAMKSRELESLFQQAPLDVAQIEEEYRGYADRLLPYLSTQAEKHVAEAIEAGKKVLFEGAHGTYLDQTYGTYPYVTSSSTLSAGVAAAAGIGPTKISHVVGVVKCYTTRVGGGPFPSALTKEEEGIFLSHREAREVATTTGRHRRMGWFDAPLVRTALRLNGANSMALMKLDVLDKLSTLKICIGYRAKDGSFLDAPPAMTEDWETIEPIYEEMSGWQENTSSVDTYDALPVKAKAYIKRLEELCGCPASFLSLGPEREKTLHLQSLL